MYSPKNSYLGTNPQRLNPEFVGISTKYHEQKKHRQDSDYYRKNVESNFHYMLNVKKEMEQNVQKKAKELSRLQKIRERHNQDVKHRIQEQERKKRELEQLKKKSADQRNAMKNGVKLAQSVVKSGRVENKTAMKTRIHEQEQELKDRKNMLVTENNMRFKSIQTSKKMANNHVNQFHKERNKKSLNNYLSKIEDEERKSQQNYQQIRRMKEAMSKYNQEVHSKQDRLKKLMDQISFYSVESQKQRKANFLATGQFFRTLQTSSSQRSKPAQILKISYSAEKKPKFNFNQEQQM